MTALADAIGVLICRVFHDRLSVPTGTYYTCLECGRRYRVPWAKTTEAGVYEWTT